MKNKRSLKLWGMLLVLAMCFSIFPCSAFAAETSSAENVSVQVQSIEDAGISRETAMEVLGLSAEEAKNMDFYAIKSPRQLTFNSGDTYTFPKFTFTGDNIGSYFTVNATKLKYGAIWEIPSSQPACAIDIYLYPYGGGYDYKLRLTSFMDSSTGNKRVTGQSDWIDTVYGLDYHFSYQTEDSTWGGKEITSSVTMVIGVV